MEKKNMTIICNHVFALLHTQRQNIQFLLQSPAHPKYVALRIMGLFICVSAVDARDGLLNWIGCARLGK